MHLKMEQFLVINKKEKFKKGEIFLAFFSEYTKYKSTCYHKKRIYMKKQYLNAPTILLSLLMFFFNIKSSIASQASSEILTITERLTTHITKASLVAGGLMGLVSLFVRIRDKRTNEDGDWTLNGTNVTKEDRWNKLRDNFFISLDTIPYFLDITLGTLGDYKKVTIEKTLDDGTKEVFEKTKCFATGSGLFGWIDKKIFQNTPKAANDALVTVTAFGLVQKAIQCNSNKEQEKKSK